MRFFSFVVVILFFSCKTYSSIVDLGNITRDTESNLDWLDVSATQGMTFTEVQQALLAGGSFESWRLATHAEFLTLSTQLGLSPLLRGYPESEIETTIQLLGDTYDNFLDATNHANDVSPTGFGATQGIIVDAELFDGRGGTNYFEMIFISIEDIDLVDRATGVFVSDETADIRYYQTLPDDSYGSFLVRSTAVPLQGSAFYLLSAVVSFLFSRFKTKKNTDT